MEIKIGYKVVSIDQHYLGEKRVSPLTKGVGEVEYREGQWVFPKANCGPLAVFNDLETAERFLQVKD